MTLFLTLRNTVASYPISGQQFLSTATWIINLQSWMKLNISMTNQNCQQLINTFKSKIQSVNSLDRCAHETSCCMSQHIYSFCFFVTYSCEKFIRWLLQHHTCIDCVQKNPRQVTDIWMLCSINFCQLINSTVHDLLFNSAHHDILCFYATQMFISMYMFLKH
jgi:hypothetical protein